jgi:hypothetical protein
MWDFQTPLGPPSGKKKGTAKGTKHTKKKKGFEGAVSRGWGAADRRQHVLWLKNLSCGSYVYGS